MPKGQRLMVGLTGESWRTRLLRNLFLFACLLLASCSPPQPAKRAVVAPSSTPTTSQRVSLAVSRTPPHLPPASFTPPPSLTPLSLNSPVPSLTPIPTWITASLQTPPVTLLNTPTESPVQTQTAEPITQTLPLPTVTPSATPTVTFSPTPTASQTPPVAAVQAALTLTAAVGEQPEGWKIHRGPGFRLALPSSWRTVDVAQEGIQPVLEILEGLEGPWASQMAVRFADPGLAPVFWAVDPQPARDGHAMLWISHTPRVAFEGLEPICVAQLTAGRISGDNERGHQCGLRANGLEVAWLVHRDPFYPASQQLEYLFLDQTELWGAHYTVSEPAWPQYAPIFFTSAGTFRR